nr:MAG TPA: hypothetical protein [Caudoviricetes sp.]DAL17883.1 MAG TPA_asm: hypothetical protein [Caudoviricetes sp.]
MLEPSPQDVVDRHPVAEVTPDRCDAKDCGAQAFVYAEYRTGSISFCGHHAAQHMTRLTETAVTVIDLRHLIGP